MASDGGADTPERIFARRQRQERQRRHWRYTDLAEAVAAQGITLNSSAFAKTETGGRAVRLDEAAAVAKAFGLLLSQMTSEAGTEELRREFEDIRAQVIKANDETDDALARAVRLRNRERELIIILGDNEEPM
jgi:transcriptional regulator with XRE-family HTH domain